MGLKRKTPDTIKVDLTVTAAGEKLTFAVTYNNPTPNEYDEKVKEIAERVTAAADGNEIRNINVALVLLLVKEWDAEYELTESDLLEADRDRPGILFGIVRGYHNSRQASVVKN